MSMYPASSSNISGHGRLSSYGNLVDESCETAVLERNLSVSPTMDGNDIDQESEFVEVKTSGLSCGRKPSNWSNFIGGIGTRVCGWRPKRSGGTVCPPSLSEQDMPNRSSCTQVPGGTDPNLQSSVVPDCELSVIETEALNLRTSLRLRFPVTKELTKRRLREEDFSCIEKLARLAKHRLYPEVSDAWYAIGWWSGGVEKLRAMNEDMDDNSLRALLSWLVFCVNNAKSLNEKRKESEEQARRQAALLIQEDWENVDWKDCDSLPWEQVEREELLTMTPSVFPIRSKLYDSGYHRAKHGFCDEC